MNIDKIYTVLVTYNPDYDLLRKNIKILYEQTDYVILCNNSIVNITAEMFDYSDRLKIINFNQNIGIAAAQNVGMKWAFDNGADFILQMDQDSTPDNDMVRKLYETYSKVTDLGYKVGLVGPIDYDRVTLVQNKARIFKGRSLTEDNTIYLVDSTLSSGSLIEKSAFMRTGDMLEELFIDVVDHEYCWRLIDKGFVVCRSNQARLAHRLGDGHQKIFGLIYVGVPSPFRHYYAFRNILYLMKFKYVPSGWKCLSILKLILKILFYPIVLNNGCVRLYYMLRGVKDAMLGNMGKLNNVN